MVGRDTQPRWVNPVTQLHKDHNLTWRLTRHRLYAYMHKSNPCARGHTTAFTTHCRKKLQNAAKDVNLSTTSAQLFKPVIKIRETSYLNSARLSETGWTLTFFRHLVFRFFFFPPENKLSLFKKASELETNINGDKVTKHTQ